MNLLYKVKVLGSFFPLHLKAPPPHGICNHQLIERRAFCHTHADLPPLRLLHADRHAKELQVLCTGEGPTTTHGPQICQFFFFLG